MAQKRARGNIFGARGIFTRPLEIRGKSTINLPRLLEML
jgi:hypothetical protein